VVPVDFIRQCGWSDCPTHSPDRWHQVPTHPGLHADGWWYGDRALVDDETPLGDFTPGRYGWLLDNVRPLAEPIPAKGKQGLWRPDAVLMAAVEFSSVDPRGDE
jgi:hypothetical protein